MTGVDVDVDVWIADLDVDPGPLWALLDQAERERAGRFLFDNVRRRYVVAHAMVRSVLGPDTVVKEGKHGKPYAVGGPWFNLSHSGERALLAVSTDAAVGVDIEEVRPVERLDALAERVMSPAEFAAFGQVEEKTEFFFDVWTRKEAVVKASGAGITSDLRSVSYDGVTVTALEAGDGYAAALAVAGVVDLSVRAHVWRPLPARWPPGGEGAGSARQARPADSEGADGGC